jgi:hypothetical protein
MDTKTITKSVAVTQHVALLPDTAASQFMWTLMGVVRAHDPSMIVEAAEIAVKNTRNTNLFNALSSALDMTTAD